MIQFTHLILGILSCTCTRVQQSDNKGYAIDQLTIGYLIFY